MLKALWLLVWYMQRVAPSQASTASVPFSAPPQTPLFGERGKMYLKSAISRTFCQGYMIIGVRGPMLLMLSKIVVPVAGSFSMVGAWWCSPIEGPGIAELTRARWLKSSRLDPQSALQQTFNKSMLIIRIRFSITHTMHSIPIPKLFVLILYLHCCRSC